MAPLSTIRSSVRSSSFSGAAGQAVLDRLDGLGDRAEAERHLGLLGREQPLQDPQLDAGLRRRVADRQLVEALLQAAVDVGWLRHGRCPLKGQLGLPWRAGSTEPDGLGCFVCGGPRAQLWATRGLESAAGVPCRLGAPRVESAAVKVEPAPAPLARSRHTRAVDTLSRSPGDGHSETDTGDGHRKRTPGRKRERTTETDNG